MNYDLIVIGGGAAGLAAARGAAGAGRRVVMLVDGPIGGDCTFTGCVPSKTLIETASTGVPFEAAMERVHRTIDQIAATESADVLRGEGVDVIEGCAAFIDAAHLEVDGTTYSADRVVLASGSSPVVPPAFAGSDAVTTQTFWSLTTLPASTAVIGGGAVGCELAQALARFDTRVTLIEEAGRLLPIEEADASAVVARALAAVGVDVILSASIAQIEGKKLIFDHGRAIDADQVVLAAGRRPDTSKLSLPAAGVEIDERGSVITDGRLRTTAKGVYAAGDVTGRLPFTHAADAMGRLAARNAFSRTGHRFDANPIPWVTFTDPEVARVGIREDQAAEQGGRVAYLPLSEVDRAIAANRTDGFVKIIAGPRTGIGWVGGGKILGATIVAPRAGEMIAEMALAMRTGMFTGRLARTVHAYPTYSVAIQQATAQFFTTIGGRTARPARAS